MTKNHSQNDIPELDDFFAAARQENEGVSSDLMNRILSDAADQQPDLRRVAAGSPQHRNWFWKFSDAFGGWQATGALTACAVAGLWIGYASPDSLSEISDLVLNKSGITDVDEDYFSIDDILAES